LLIFITPQYSRDTAKIGVKHQVINKFVYASNYETVVKVGTYRENIFYFPLSVAH
jgi:hypothetical protein